MLFHWYILATYQDMIFKLTGYSYRLSLSVASSRFRDRQLNAYLPYRYTSSINPTLGLEKAPAHCNVRAILVTTF